MVFGIQNKETFSVFKYKNDDSSALYITIFNFTNDYYILETRRNEISWPQFFNNLISIKIKNIG